MGTTTPAQNLKALSNLWQSKDGMTQQTLKKQGEQSNIN